MRKWYTLKMNLTPSVEFSYEILSRWNLVEKSYEKKTILSNLKQGCMWNRLATTTYLQHSFKIKKKVSDPETKNFLGL